MSAAHLLAVALGGAIGASLRYMLYHLFHVNWGVSSHWAVGLVNFLGCIGIGVLFGWLDARGVEGERLRTFVGWGILGAFTTFSTYAMDGLALMRGRALEGVIYLAGSVLLGVLLVWVGYRATLALAPTPPPG